MINPLQPDGSILAATGNLVHAAYGIDLRSAKIDTAAFASPGFSVDGSGNVTVQKLCVGSTCLTEAQVQKLMQLIQ